MCRVWMTQYVMKSCAVAVYLFMNEFVIICRHRRSRRKRRRTSTAAVTVSRGSSDLFVGAHYIHSSSAMKYIIEDPFNSSVTHLPKTIDGGHYINCYNRKSLTNWICYWQPLTLWFRIHLVVSKKLKPSALPYMQIEEAITSLLYHLTLLSEYYDMRKRTSVVVICSVTVNLWVDGRLSVTELSKSLRRLKNPVFQEGDLNYLIYGARL